jgi:TetR/AcrR family transcriptional repressor of mexJK operon
MKAKAKAREIIASRQKRRSVKPDRRPRRPSLSNEQLLDKALDLFLEQGYERTSIETITATAGMAKRTVYLRYGDKKTLFIAALQRAIEDWIVPIERLRSAECDSLEQTLLGVSQILVDNVLSPAGLRLLRLTNAESGHMPDIGPFTVRAGTDRTIAYLADLFHRHLGREDWGLAAAEEAAEAFIHLVVGGPANAAAWGVTRDKEAIDRRIGFSVRVFLHGLLLQPAERPGVPLALEDEYRSLKKLLSQTMLQLDAIGERLERAGMRATVRS